MKFPRIIIIFLAICSFSRVSTYAQNDHREWHVSASGNDMNNGESGATPFRTLQKASSVVHAGDIVLIGSGVYTDSGRGNGSTVLDIRQSGRPDAWITWKAKPGQHPEIRPTGWNGIHISGSYHIIDGLTVTGGNDSITLMNAINDSKNTRPNPGYNTNGIFVEGRRISPDAKPHHIIIKNCTVSKCPGGGIVGIETDYLTIEDCRVFENAWFMRYGGSGISTLNNWAFDDKPGYHIIIRRNLVWNNKTLVPWEKIGKLSDGNGIILDVTDVSDGATNPNADSALKSIGTPANPVSNPAVARRPEWHGRALIANNISAYNGGSGIHTFRTRHVDIINNITYWNGQIVGYQELFANRSDDIRIENNIIVPRPGGKVTSNNRNTNIVWDYNLYAVEQKFFAGSHDIVADPMLVNIQTMLDKTGFRPARQSAATNSGDRDVMIADDITGKKRPVGAPDRGAYEQ